MKKFLALSLTAMLGSTALMACGNSGETQNNDALNDNVNNSVAEGKKSPADIKGKVTYAVPAPEHDIIREEKNIEAFNKVYPNIEVTLVPFDTGIGFDETLTAQAATSELPDVVTGWWNDMDYVISNGWVQPLDEFLANDDESQYIPKNLIDNYKYNGKTYAIPSRLQFGGVMVNLDLADQLNLDLPEYDWTIDDFKTFVKNGTTKEFSGLDSVGGGIFERALVGMFSSNLSGDTYDNSTGTVNYSDESWIKAISLQKELKEIPGLVASELKNSKLTDEGKEDDYQKKFGKDVSAFHDSRILAGPYGTEDLWWTGSVKFNYDIYPLPHDPSVGYRQAVVVDQAFMTTAAKDKEAAFELLKWISYGKDGTIDRMNYRESTVDGNGNEKNRDFLIPSSQHPEVSDHFNNVDFVAGGVKYMYNNLDKSFRFDQHRYVPGFSKTKSDIIDPLVQKILKGEADAVSTAKELDEKANASLKESLDIFNKSLK